MSHDPRWLREASRLLSSLLQAPEEELAAFVHERLDDRAGVSVEQLRDAREILILLGIAFEEPSAERWQGVAHARRSLESWEEGLKRAQDDPQAAHAPASSSPPPPPSPPRSPALHSPASPATGPAASPWAPAAPVPSPHIGHLPSKDAAPAAASDPLAGTMAQQGPVDTRTLPFKAIDATPPQRSRLEPHPQMGQTAPTGKGPKSAPLPFGSAASPSTASPSAASPSMGGAAAASAPPASVKLSLEQYARFCAEKVLWPDHGDHIRRRYGLDAEGERGLDVHYRTAFVADPETQQRFNQLFVQARRQLGG